MVKLEQGIYSNTETSLQKSSLIPYKLLLSSFGPGQLSRLTQNQFSKSEYPLDPWTLKLEAIIATTCARIKKVTKVPGSKVKSSKGQLKDKVLSRTHFMLCLTLSLSYYIKLHVCVCVYLIVSLSVPILHVCVHYM